VGSGTGASSSAKSGFHGSYYDTATGYLVRTLASFPGEGYLSIQGKVGVDQAAVRLELLGMTDAVSEAASLACMGINVTEETPLDQGPGDFGYHAQFYRDRAEEPFFP
jgi:hypothetical protein